jgi:hypothetical protein
MNELLIFKIVSKGDRWLSVDDVWMEIPYLSSDEIAGALRRLNRSRCLSVFRDYSGILRFAFLPELVGKFFYGRGY